MTPAERRAYKSACERAEMHEDLQTYFSYTSYRDVYTRADACAARRKIAADLQRLAEKAEWLRTQVEEGDPRSALAATREFHAVTDAREDYARLLGLANLMEDVLSRAPRQVMHRTDATAHVKAILASA